MKACVLGCVGIRAARRFASSASAAALRKTALFDSHVEMNGKMVEFAGYLLPVQYEDSILNSHLQVRQSAGLFDVSHMGQVIVKGEQRVEFLESLVVGDIQSLKADQARLSLLTNEAGGIIDDCLVTKKKDHLYVVVNGACKEKDVAHMQKAVAAFNSAKKASITVELLTSRSLLALQGPKAAAVLNALLPEGSDLSKLDFMSSFHSKVGTIEDCWINRCGYTGEDGFEISVRNQDAVALLNLLLSDKRVLPAGLGVRDSLRLEAGLCLYGHDIDEQTTPVEAGLLWTISKRRREQGGFPGHSVIAKQIREGVAKKRVGLEILEGAPARENSEIISKTGEKIGHITSGGFSPSLKKKISMGYISTPFAEAGTEVGVKVRGKAGAARVVKLPFVPTNYYKAPKA